MRHIFRVVLKSVSITLADFVTRFLGPRIQHGFDIRNGHPRNLAGFYVGKSLFVLMNRCLGASIGIAKGVVNASFSNELGGHSARPHEDAHTSAKSLMNFKSEHGDPTAYLVF